MCMIIERFVSEFNKKAKEVKTMRKHPCYLLERISVIFTKKCLLIILAHFEVLLRTYRTIIKQTHTTPTESYQPTSR